jgi:hypothetical protein
VGTVLFDDAEAGDTSQCRGDPCVLTMTPALPHVHISAETLQRLFREAWPKRKHPPDIDACHDVAKSINSVTDRINKLKAQGPQTPSPALGATLKYGRLFLRHLATASERLEDKLASRPDSTNRWYKGALARMEMAAVHVQAVLDACPDEPPITVHASNFIAQEAQGAWRRSGERVPLSVRPDDAMCKFVVAALACTGVHKSASTVSDELRYRSNRRRSGKKRSPT